MSPERERFRYLTRLIRLEDSHGRHPSKKSNWMHFCRCCGADISTCEKWQRRCARCRGGVQSIEPASPEPNPTHRRSPPPDGIMNQNASNAQES